MSNPHTPSSSRTRAPQASNVPDIFNFERHSEDGRHTPSTITTQKSLQANDRLSSPHQSNTYLNSTSSPRASNEADTSSGEIVQEGLSLPVGDRAYGNQRLRRTRTNSLIGLSSAHQKTPSRSFFHRSFHGPHGKLSSLYSISSALSSCFADQAQYSSQAVRDETAELASIAATGFASSVPRHNSPGPPTLSTMLDVPVDGAHRSTTESRPESDAIEEESEPPSPDEMQASPAPRLAPSALTNMMHRPPPSSTEHLESDQSNDDTLLENPTDSRIPPLKGVNSTSSSEMAPLLKKPLRTAHDYGSVGDLERQTKYDPKRENSLTTTYKHVKERSRAIIQIAAHPKSWNSKAVWHKGIVFPATLLPSVFLGLLLNILDALSYGMILFPLGQPVFANLGADGISMFYVSTIVSQLVFSCGGSIFKGGIGSEMIEVVPFFHKMAFTILHHVGEDKPESVLATTILSFALSSILTGLIFFIMGACRIGELIGFFPRHILIGCIGGVGFFLVATGVEVSARLEGNLEYSFETLRKLFHSDTVPLWIIPLVLAVVLRFVKRRVKSNFLVGGYFIIVAVIFYLVKVARGLGIERLREKGWVFDAPAAENPWYHFYTLYSFGAVNWAALLQTIPAMFALTFFGVLHVPINVPALGISTGEDNLNVDRELRAHGLSNALSGLLGSIQNYLVYTNSLLFIDSGGSHRLAGTMLAAATFGVLIIGPVIIGYIPIMVVGALIFLLGIDLLEEAVVDTWGKVHRLEYLTIIVIVVTMGLYDFVVGILVGIVLACLNYVVQTSRKPAIKATYSGQIASSTVRRHPMQANFLYEAGQQTHVFKLAGFLFFGTIVSVENHIRALLDDEAFKQRPIQFLVIDFANINGIDFSAAEAFTRINRILMTRHVRLVMSGLEIDGEIGKSFRNVGLFDDEEVEIFESLNEALEFCENELLKAFYRRQELLNQRHASHIAATKHLDVPQPRPDIASSFPTETMFSSPRHNHLQHVASRTLTESSNKSQPRWSNYQQPLPLLLQLFETLSDNSEDFWWPITNYFKDESYSSGATLYHRGDTADAFLLLEEGILRADYDLPQGRYSELIVAGRPCGELPFFSRTERTANVTAEKDSKVWMLNEERWKDLRNDYPEIAFELLEMVVKLNKERMDAITRYILTSG